MRNPVAKQYSASEREQTPIAAQSIDRGHSAEGQTGVLLNKPRGDFVSDAFADLADRAKECCTGGASFAWYC